MKKILSILLILTGIYSYGQSELTSGYFNYHLTDRYEIMSDSLPTHLFSSVKPYRRDIVSDFTEPIRTLSTADKFNQRYLLNDNVLYNKEVSNFRTQPILSHFYKTQSALFLVQEDNFNLVVNPLLGFAGGTESQDTLPIYRNSRGIEIRGNIGNKVGFYSSAIENQVQYPSFLRQKHATTGVVDGTTLHKKFGDADAAQDYFNATGYITFSPIKEIAVQFGQDKNFIGNGYRSLILSDFSAPYPFLKINTQVWKFNYQNLFSQHIDFITQDESANNGRKFSAFHHLSMNIGKNVNIGLFENIIFDRSDSSMSNRYELAYLNPIIFYRAVEHGLNSSDNAVLGLDWKWNFLKRFSFYGQFILDEFVKDEVFGRTESWVNKWGYQAGLKYINVANVNNLDLQLEVNQVRPYVYQHRSKAQNWIHYNQSLAHPLGANLRELVAIVRYQPANRFNINAVYSLSKQGIDTSLLSTNFGGNYLRTYSDGLVDPAPLFQGIENTISTMSIDVSYMLWHNLFLDAGIFIRNQSNMLMNQDKKNMIFRFGMRLNLASLDYRY